MNEQLIVTHPGTAHFDEVTAISLIVAANNKTEFRIERREPTQIELNNPEIWVVDIGNRYEPEKLNFDHHQSLDCPASFVLIAKHLGLLETLSILPWWQFKDSVDRIGPVESARLFQAGDDLVNRNPMEDWLVNLFTNKPQESISLLKSFGAYVVTGAYRLKKQIEFWKSAQRLMISGVPAIIGETRESLGIEEFRRLEKNPPDIIISMDRRSEGWRLYRSQGSPVDFSRIANCPEIEFAHKSGFLAKTRDHLTIDQLIPLLRKSITK